MSSRGVQRAVLNASWEARGPRWRPKSDPSCIGVRGVENSSQWVCLD